LLRQRRGDAAAARRLLEAAVASGNPRVVPLAQANLGGQLLDAGEVERARELLEAAAGSADQQAVPLAQANLGMLLLDAGEVARARELLEAAIGSADTSPFELPARFSLALLATRGGDLPKGAEHARATSKALQERTGIPPAQPGWDGPTAGSAHLMAADHLYDCQYVNDAAQLLDAMLEHCGTQIEPVAFAAAQAQLGRARFHQDNYAEAERLLRAALGTSLGAGEAGWPAQALSRFHLASVLLVGRDDLDEARDLLQPLLQSRDPLYLAGTLQLLGKIAWINGRQFLARNQTSQAQVCFVEAELLLRNAEAEAEKSGDTTLLEDVRGDLALVTDLPGGPAAPSTAAVPQVNRDALPASEDAVLVDEAALDEEQPAVARSAGAQPGGPLPPLLLVLLGEIAAAEGDAMEAEYWFGRAESTPPAQASPIRPSDSVYTLAQPHLPEARARAQLARAAMLIERGEHEQACSLLTPLKGSDEPWAVTAQALLAEATTLQEIVSE
jgi:tetratricopeptide (TPR) repeat protein